MSADNLQDPGALQQTHFWSLSTLSLRTMTASVESPDLDLDPSVTAFVDHNTQIWMIAATQSCIRLETRIT